MLLTDALFKFMNCKQQPNEGLMAYVKRWKEDRDNLKTHIGTRVLDYFVEHLPEYREAGDTVDDEESTGEEKMETEEQKEMKKAAFDQWMAYLLLKNSD